MIQPKYKRNLQKNYMILQGEERTYNNYQLSMIRENNIKGLLQLEVRSIDNSIQYYYDISGKQTVSTVFKKQKIRYSDLKVILLEIHTILQQIKSYLLDESHVVLEPEYMYCNFECTKLELLFNIDYENEERTIFTKLAEYLIEQIDHEDEDAVSVAYKFYQSIRKENFIFEQFLEVIQEKNNEEVEKLKKEVIDVEVSRDDIGPSKDLTKDVIADLVEKKSTQIKSGEKESAFSLNNKTLPIPYFIKVLSVAGVFLVGGIYIRIKLPFYQTEQFITFALAMITVIGGIIHYILKEREKEESSIPSVTNRDNSKDKFETIIPMKSGKREVPISISNKVKTSHIPVVEANTNNQTVFMGKTLQEQRTLKGRINNIEEVYTIASFPCIIGKAKSHADIVLDHDSVSRIHARIIEGKQGLYIEDLNSTNGTYKNGIILETNEEVLLEVKDEIQIGGVYLEYR